LPINKHIAAFSQEKIDAAPRRFCVEKKSRRAIVAKNAD